MSISNLLKKLFSASADNFPKKAIRLVKTTEPHVSKLGGEPNLPESVVWPLNPDGVELDFLTQIHFPEVPGGLGLPTSGTLFVFYDCEEQPWGSDKSDRQYWKVIFSEDTLPPHTRSRQIQRKDYDDTEQAFLVFEVFESHAENAETEDDGKGMHQMLGYPLYVQDSDMAPGQTLLLQLDSDETGEGPYWMWSDYGRLFFWIKPEDLEQRRFDRVTLVLECC